MDDHVEGMSREQVLRRVDKMLAAGRITEDEAERIRNEPEQAVAEVRRRHVQEWVEGAVASGRMPQAEADELLAALDRDEDPSELMRRRHQSR